MSGVLDLELVVATRAGEQVGEHRLLDDLSARDDRDAIAQLLDLAHEMAREQNGHPLVCQRPHESAHVAHAGGIEPGSGLVEQQQLRLAEERSCDTEALAHPVE